MFLFASFCALVDCSLLPLGAIRILVKALMKPVPAPSFAVFAVALENSKRAALRCNTPHEDTLMLFKAGATLLVLQGRRELLLDGGGLLQQLQLLLVQRARLLQVDASFNEMRA
jgi:hypothetical protein